MQAFRKRGYDLGKDGCEVDEDQRCMLEGAIALGALHRYYAFSIIEGGSSFKEMVKSIERSSLSMEHFVQEAHDELQVLGTKFKQVAKTVMQASSPEDAMGFGEGDEFVRNEDVVVTPLAYDSNRASFNIESLTLGYCEQLDSSLEVEQEHFAKYYGEWPCSVQARFVLSPWLVRFVDGKRAYLNVIIILLANGIGFIKFELPLAGITYDTLSTHYLCDLIHSFKLLKPDTVERDSIFDVASFLADGLAKESQATIRMSTDCFDHLILADFDGQVDDFSELDKNVKEALFRISHRPVPPRRVGFYCEDAEKFFADQSLDYGLVRVLMNPIGRCTSLMSAQFRNNYDQNEMDEAGNISLARCGEINDLRLVNSQLEFAILVMMMKRINNERLLAEQLVGSMDCLNARRRYESGKMFLIEFQSHCFGSVKEQIKTFEQKMPFYVRSEELAEKNSAFEAIMEINREERRWRLEYFAAIMGLLLVVLFALPSVRDTVSILREMIPLGDVPWVTIDSMSIALWILFLLVIAVRAWRLRPAFRATHKGKLKGDGWIMPIGQC